MNENFDDLMGEAASRNWESLEELNAWLASQTQDYNTRPQEGLAGLSPEQAHRLFAGDWDTQGPVRLNTSLMLSDLRHARILNNARILLSALDEAGAIKATAASRNLPRRFVGELIEKMSWEEGYLEVIKEVNKVIDEEDVYQLHILRIVLELGRLIKLRGGKFSITKKGRGLMSESRAGELYAHLFRTHFRSLNLAYLDLGHENSALQQTLPMTLHRLSREGRTWRSPDALADRALMEEVFDQPEHPHMGDEVYWQFRSRVLGPLERFGLLEKRSLDGGDRISNEAEYRPSPLFRKFLRFEF